MAEYLYGTYGELGESTGSVAASSGDVAVICGTAPVNLIRGYASAGIVNRPVKVSDYNDFKNALGTAQDWGKYTLAMVGEAFFNNPMGNLGPIYCVNVLDPDVHRSAEPTVKGLSFVNGKASFASEDIILDSFALEGKTEGTDYEISYNFTDHKVTVKSADADNMLTGTIQASYYTVDVTDIGAGDIVGEETADGQLTGLQSAKLIYQGFNAVPNLYAAPGWSDRPEVYRALCSAATKMNDAQRVKEAVAAGVDCCGENRVQELVQKQAQDAYRGAPVHFIGHLQTNKVKQVVGKVDLIQSLDRRELLEAVDRQAEKLGICQDVLLEINIGAEESKSGFSPEEALRLLPNLANFSHVFVKGLMAIPPISQNPGDNLKFFEKMHQLYVDIGRKKYDNVSMVCLSMGMSDDFEDAIAEGATMIRVGTGIFGARNYNK